MDVTERAGWQAEWVIPKFYTPHDEIVRGLRQPFVDIFPFEVGRVGPFPAGNLLLANGITASFALLTGSSGATAYSNANAQLAVGTSSASEAQAQTGLQSAAAGTDYTTMDSGFPTYTGTQVTWRSTFGTAKANFAWNEFSLSNGVPGTGASLNRKVSAQGTKLNTQTWIPSLVVTLT